MRKLLLILLSAVAITNAFAYEMIVDNNTTTDLKFTNRNISEDKWCVVKANDVKTCVLDLYTSYDIKYEGKWARQKAFSLQKQTILQINVTPDDQAAGRNNFHVDIKNSPMGVGSFNTLNPTTFSGDICKDDTAGFICKLGAEAQIKDTTQIKITVTNVNSK